MGSSPSAPAKAKSLENADFLSVFKAFSCFKEWNISPYFSVFIHFLDSQNLVKLFEPNQKQKEKSPWSSFPRAFFVMLRLFFLRESNLLFRVKILFPQQFLGVLRIFSVLPGEDFSSPQKIAR